MIGETIILPSIIIDSHCHGRDMKQAHKTTVKQTMKEAQRGNIDITIFMPNPDPPITSLEVLDRHDGIIELAREETGTTKQQYVYFGATDENFGYCEMALQRKEVAGVKFYPKKSDGSSVTTGTGIGVSRGSSIFSHLTLTRAADKVGAFHCDDPDIISVEGNTKRAEIEYVKKVIRIAKTVPGVKILVCHASCRETVELVLQARGEGMDIMVEFVAHYLWFDSEGTNWNPCLPWNFYHCYNNLRGKEDREYLVNFLAKEDSPVIIGSDTACHLPEEKMKGAGGIPSNQEMVAVVLTLARQMGISNQQVIRLFCLNAAKFFRIPICGELKPYKLEKRVVDATYNNGIVVNPWAGSELYFPVPVEK
jgi:dihydroorotase